MVGGMSGKDRPCRETTLICYKSTHRLFRAQNNARDYIENYTAFSVHCKNLDRAWIITMTLEEIRGQENTMENADRVQSAGAALEELLVAAKKQDYLTVGVYESAKVMNVDPDSVAFCVLATDEEYECDIALQIHFTLIQAFCFDNDINVVRVNDIERLADLVSADETGEPKDAHCILVTSPSANPWKDPALDKLSLFCEESRSVYDWVPTITLPER
ncbi:hypothetical protein PFLUV_G00071990 [Perca fluviatilis]|uniref:Growth arrest and DNA damage-inducible protein GADD45 gamma n=1 Tax=Perca fluviatilis TaxID=8168 RepID=A0A6A5FCI8_PERFL|nr:growth arrest and DNA-damage-inducible, gamma a [Perca fluviatilis]KAF1389299.1 hypothetical protein PFLUV_G00071990 [Perca fluviatilis]